MTNLSKALARQDGYGYNILGLDWAAIPLQQATRSEALLYWGTINRNPLAGSTSLDAARCSSSFAAGNASVALRASSLSRSTNRARKAL